MSNVAHQIDSEQNNDVRSIMLDLFGSNATCIDSRHNEVENQQEALFDMGDSLRLLVIYPMGRMFAFGVPKQNDNPSSLMNGQEIKTCAQAQYWLECF